MNKKIYDLISKTISLPFQEFLFEETVEFRKLFLDKKKDLEKLKAVYKTHSKIKLKYVQSIKKDKINSYDQVYMIFDQYYSINKILNFSNESDFLNDYLKKIAKTFIAHRNGKFVLKYWKTNSELLSGLEYLEKVELWNSFSRFMVSDLLVASYLLDNNMDELYNMENYNWQIFIGDYQLDKILTKGVSENHIHINAGYNFGVLWNQLLNPNNNSVRKNLCKVLGKYNVGEIKNRIYKRIEAAILIRYFLEYLLKNNRTVISCLESEIDEKRSLVNDVYINVELNLVNMIEKFINGKDFEIHHFENVLEYFTNFLVKSKNIKTELYSEKNFILLALKKTRMKDKDSDFNKLFWQYIRVKNQLYNEITQNNDEQGLDYFVDKYYEKVIDIFEDEVEKMYHNILVQIKNNSLKKIELRVAPKKDYKKLIEKIRIFFKAYLKILDDKNIRDSEIPVIGLVFHLIKAREDLPFEKCFFKESENEELIFKGEHLFYGKIIKEYEVMAKHIRTIRLRCENISHYIVGVDTASIESFAEPWVFAPIYQTLRDSYESSIVYGTGMKSIKTLGFTYHVGEDYRHIMSGLRHIYEVIEFLGYHAGDRIGHGISLAIDVENWIVQNPVVFMPRIEYLENLVWIWGISDSYYKEIDLENDISLERKILECAKEIYGDTSGITPHMLWQAYREKFKTFEVNEDEVKKFCIKNSKNNLEYCVFSSLEKKYDEVIWDYKKIIYSNHCRICLERMYEIVQVKVYKEEKKSLENLQRKIRKLINKRGIVVETNPTSNLSISGMNRLYETPIKVMNNSGLSSIKENDKSLIISINSDDPSIFNSTVSNEFGYIYHALQYQGYSKEYILEWIDKIRNWGLESSFVDDRILNREERKLEIKKILENLSFS